MSLVRYCFRHLKNLCHHQDPIVKILEEPFAEFAKDPFFRDPIKYMLQAADALEKDHGIEGIYSDSEVKADGKKVEIHLDVQNFTPDQINVKTIGNEIMVEGKKEIKKEDGWTRSHFERRFLLPEGFPPERVECHFDKGKLKLIAFREQPLEEKTIPIQEKSKESESS